VESKPSRPTATQVAHQNMLQLCRYMRRDLGLSEYQIVCMVIGALHTLALEDLSKAGV
jgi:hypothetical protein